MVQKLIKEDSSVNLTSVKILHSISNDGFEDDDEKERFQQIQNERDGSGGAGTRKEDSDEGTVASKVSDVGYRPIAIRVRNAVKSFKQKDPPILRNLNMTVGEGTIYTLLGSSGCGKTTLLSCIIGFQRVDAGEILVFGKEPGSNGSGVPGKLVGYMPQETSLYPTLTIGELLEYFGMLYGMSKTEIKERTQFLIKFLQLPRSEQRIESLSGGQQRRTSFAVSLMPDPPLLILDEPTVGVDPLLRESIWDHLVDLVSRKKTTVIITTHYMEESRKSDTIGFMRNGRLLIEQSPESLMEQHGTSLITPIMLKLCQNDSSLTQQPPCLSEIDKSISSMCHYHDFPVQKGTSEVMSTPTSQTQIKSNGMLSKAQYTKNHLCAMMKKNVLLMTRNYVILLFLICVPAIQATLFCLAVGEDPKQLPFGVVNHEVNFTGGPCEVASIQSNRSNGDEEIDCSLDLLSCRFLKKIPEDTIILQYYETEEKARQDLQMGRIWGFMRFPEGFSSYLLIRSMLTSGQLTTDNETFEGSEISLEVDASSKQITSTYYKAFADAFQDFSRDLLSTCGLDKRAADYPLKYLPPAFGDFGSAFRDFLAPSLVLGILFFFPMISSAMQCIREKKQGTHQRSVVAGVRTWETLAAYSVTESVIVVFQTALGFFIVSILFQIQIRGEVALVFALCIVIGLSGVSVGFLIGSFCREETDAALLSMAVFFPNFMLSGMFWPIEGLPITLRYISYLLPCTLAGESIRSIINRGWGFVHPKVWPGFAVAGAWIVIYWTLNVIYHSLASFRRRKNNRCWFGAAKR